MIILQWVRGLEGGMLEWKNLQNFLKVCKLFFPAVEAGFRYKASNLYTRAYPVHIKENFVY